LLGCGVVGVLFGGGFVFGLCGVFVVGVGCVVRGLGGVIFKIDFIYIISHTLSFVLHFVNV
jgi:hypothetical protein